MSFPTPPSSNQESSELSYMHPVSRPHPRSCLRDLNFTLQPSQLFSSKHARFQRVVDDGG
jgi:hypothetical protein